MQHQIERQTNPFGDSRQQLAPAQRDALVETGAQREIAEVQAAMAIAKRFPRSPIEAMDRILQACTRPGLAEGALYSYSKGGSEVTGPSIRLAEAMAQAWGNVQFGIRELEQRDGESTVEAFAWDLETNVRQTKVFQVGHVRHSRKGVQRLDDPRDVYELVANQGARRLRACILGVIPGDVTEAAVAQCEATMRASADVGPEALKRLVETFAGIGVQKAQLETRLGCRLEAIRPAQLVQLRKIYQSVRDGMSAAGDWFPAAQSTASSGQAATVEEALARGKPKAKVEPEPERLREPGED